MATNIDINDVTNATTVENGTGIFDRLIGAAFLHIEKQVDEQRLTQSSAGEVYSAAIQSAMAQAIQFVLQEKQIEAQVDLLVEQKKVSYVERVIKDKEAAALGMDKVVKVANTPATTEEVYTPKYEE